MKRSRVRTDKQNRFLVFRVCFEIAEHGQLLFGSQDPCLAASRNSFRITTRKMFCSFTNPRVELLRGTNNPQLLGSP